jgi:hypothetical protein
MQALPFYVRSCDTRTFLFGIRNKKKFTVDFRQDTSTLLAQSCNVPGNSLARTLTDRKKREVASMVRFAFRTAIAATFFVLACCLALAQGGPPAHPPRPKMLGPAKWQPSAREISAAYWTLDPGWSTTLEMRNNVIYHDLIVTPVLRSETGQETPLAPVTIAPQHVVSLNLRDAAATNHANLGSFGSARLSALTA